MLNLAEVLCEAKVESIPVTEAGTRPQEVAWPPAPARRKGEHGGNHLCFINVSSSWFILVHLSFKVVNDFLFAPFHTGQHCKET